MLDGLLGRGAFYSKCKSLIKITRTRIEAITTKRRATEKFLRKDIADLLACGLESNAHGRIGGLVAEIIRTSCYDFIDYVCEIVLKQLPLMQKHSECPEDCREAVASLMYAAARFSDLPELRDLRNIFHERYGSSLDYFVNQKFVENITPNLPSAERKIQLMRDIASEFSIKWDARDFELRTCYGSASRQDHPINQVPLHAVDRRNVAPCISQKDQNPQKLHGLVKNKNEANYQNRGRGEVLDNAREVNVGREGVVFNDDELNQRPNLQELTSNRSEEPYRVETFQKRKEHEASSLRRQLMVDPNSRLPCENSDEPKNTADSRPVTSDKDSMRGCVRESNGKRDHGVPFSRRELLNNEHDSWSLESTSRGTAKTVKSSSVERLGLHNGYKIKMDASREVVEPKEDRLNASPQTKEELPSKSEIEVLFAGRDRRNEASVRNTRTAGMGAEADSSTSTARTALPPPYVKPRKNKNEAQVDLKHPEKSVQNGGGSLTSLNTNTEEMVRRPSAADGHDGYTNEYYRDHKIGNPTPRRRHSRRRHVKSKSSSDGNSNGEEQATFHRSSHGRRRSESKKGLQILFDDDKSERNDEEERMIDKLLLHYCQKRPTVEPAGPRRLSAAESIDSHMPSVDEARKQSKAAVDAVPPPGRSMSLPHQQATPSEPKKVFSRAASFQPDCLTPAKHVHPKLPDYDDLAARFAALRRNKDLT